MLRIARDTRAAQALILFALLLAFAIRLNLLGDSNIWWDEGLAVWLGRQSIAQVAAWTAADVHPPLYFWLLGGWQRLAGETEFGARALSVMLGVLTVAATYAFAKKLRPASWLAPSAAALILATSRFHVWWSQEARMYAMAGLLVVLSLFLTLMLSRRFSWPRALAYVAVTAAALWTLYLLAFLLVVEGVFWLVHVSRARTGRLLALGRWAGLQMAVLLTIAPWLLFAVPQLKAWSVQTAFDPALFVQLYATLLSVGASTDIAQYAPITVLAAIMVVTGTVLARPRALLLPWLALLLPPLAVLALTILPRSFGYSPRVEARYLVPYAPVYAVLAGWAIGAFAARIRPLAVAATATVLALAFLLGVNVLSVRDYGAGRVLSDDYRSAAIVLRALVRPGDSVIVHTDQPWPVFAYHWPGEWVGVPHQGRIGDDGGDLQPGRVWERSDAVWLVVNEDASRLDPGRQIEKWFEARAVARREWRFGDGRVLLYVRAPERIAGLDALSGPFASGTPRVILPLTQVKAGSVLGAFVLSRAASPGHTLTFLVGDPGAPLLRLAASVTGPGGQLVSFSGRIPAEAVSGRYAITLWEPGRADTRAGELRIEAGGRMDGIAALPPEAIRADVTFGPASGVRLLGYALESADARPGGRVGLTLYWTTGAEVPQSYKVFVHVAPADGEDTLRGQSDSVPVQGRRPTSSWAPGEVIPDRYDIVLDTTPAAWGYVVFVGMYDGVTGARLGPVVGPDRGIAPADRLRLVEIPVR